MTPSRDTAGGRAYLDLQALARATGRPVQELLQLYVLEAFLDRLSHSAHRAQLVRTVNTRWRDFVDVVVLASHHPIDGDQLVESIRMVASHRGTAVVPLTSVLDGYGAIGQAKWAAWRRRQQLEGRTPESFDELIATFVAFADAAVSGAAIGRRWDPAERAWR